MWFDGKIGLPCQLWQQDWFTRPIFFSPEHTHNCISWLSLCNWLTILHLLTDALWKYCERSGVCSPIYVIVRYEIMDECATKTLFTRNRIHTGSDSFFFLIYMGLDEINRLRAYIFQELAGTKFKIKTQFNPIRECGKAWQSQIAWTKQEAALLLKVVLGWKTGKLAVINTKMFLRLFGSILLY